MATLRKLLYFIICLHPFFYRISKTHCFSILKIHFGMLFDPRNKSRSYWASAPQPTGQWLRPDPVEIYVRQPSSGGHQVPKRSINMYQAESSILYMYILLYIHTYTYIYIPDLSIYNAHVYISTYIYTSTISSTIVIGEM